MRNARETWHSTDFKHSALRHRDDAIAATALKPQNGVEGQMVPEHCAMLVAYVSCTRLCSAMACHIHVLIWVD